MVLNGMILHIPDDSATGKSAVWRSAGSGVLLYFVCNLKSIINNQYGIITINFYLFQHRIGSPADIYTNYQVQHRTRDKKRRLIRKPSRDLEET